tara:strand:+ start:2487 stop:2714 length:228 start_codon:yes stop_codon:yes gene_type:complete
MNDNKVIISEHKDRLEAAQFDALVQLLDYEKQKVAVLESRIKDHQREVAMYRTRIEDASSIAEIESFRNIINNQF